ncbi:MAG TPA: TIGR00725 family protein [bacterium]|jgi:uncharacterized protein (TIGR00725 family)|nr:TIGR00725 family protein [bacterium]HNT64435.1 TIGR00725 family protein [bacterium]HOX84718.1 TIGR00725 family protein [bacterium]HPG45441.1 TIGR00725 family protein [bacterium]HPM96783.1 TIGR00725 family protein [bacterium]
MARQRIPVIGVMGGAQVDHKVEEQAFALGAAIAEQGWILLNGGRDSGVMRASAQGAKSRNGLTIAILPGKSPNDANPFIDIAIATGMADARNLINVLSSDVVVACRGASGTLCEIALALKNRRPLILLDPLDPQAILPYGAAGQIYITKTVDECMATLHLLLPAQPAKD